MWWRVHLTALMAVVGTSADSSKPLSCKDILKLESSEYKARQLASAWARCDVKWRVNADQQFGEYLLELSSRPPAEIRGKFALFDKSPFGVRVHVAYANALLLAGASKVDIKDIELQAESLEFDRILLIQAGLGGRLSDELARLRTLRLRRKVEVAVRAEDVSALRALSPEMLGTPLDAEYRANVDRLTLSLSKTARTPEELDKVCRFLADAQDRGICLDRQRSLVAGRQLEATRKLSWKELLSYGATFAGTDSATNFEQLLQMRLGECARETCATTGDLAMACPHITDGRARAYCQARLGDLSLATARHAWRTGDLDWILVEQLRVRCEDNPCEGGAQQMNWALTSQYIVQRLKREEGIAGRKVLSKQAWNKVREELDESASHRLGGTEEFASFAPQLRQTILSAYREAEEFGNQLTSQVGTSIQMIGQQIEGNLGGNWTAYKETWLRQLDDQMTSLDYAFGLDRDQTWPRQLRGEILRLKQVIQSPNPQNEIRVRDARISVSEPRPSVLLIAFDKGIQAVIGVVPNKPLQWILQTAWEYLKELIFKRSDAVRAPSSIAIIASPRRSAIDLCGRSYGVGIDFRSLVILRGARLPVGRRGLLPPIRAAG